MMDPDERELLTQVVRKTMTSTASGPALQAALAELGWREMLAEMPEVAVPLVFRLLGETGAHAAVLADVVGEGPLPYAGGAWVEWSRTGIDGDALELPLRPVAPEGDGIPVAALAAGRVAVGWWLLGSGRAMLALARQHAMDRVQFGRPIASFQAVRHKLADTLVALDGAEAVLRAAAGGDYLGALLAKAAAGQAALLAARHCQQVLGGIGFTAEHSLHHHVKRALVLDGLLGSARELTREAGRRVIAAGSAARIVDL
jgi:NAD(P)H-hydrate repair Nnr-like enzyme with NAD(P)H-hydrate epimerase domain